MDNRPPNNNEQAKYRSDNGFDDNDAVQFAVAVVHGGTSKSTMGGIIQVKFAVVKNFFENVQSGQTHNIFTRKTHKAKYTAGRSR